MYLRQKHKDYRLASERYNEIPLLENQRTDIPSSTLEALARIFLRHGVQDRFQVSLLHRHDTLPSNTVMVHLRQSLEEDICLPQELGKCELQPCVFSWQRNEFWPIEFEEAHRSDRYMLADNTFLAELGSFLAASNMDEVLGLSCALSVRGPWVEYIRSEGPGTIARRSLDGASPTLGIVTAWAFSLADGDIVITPETTCQRTTVGVHAQVPVPPKK